MIRLAAFLLCLLITAEAQAQRVTLEATVLDAEEGRPLPGATAQIEGTARGAVSDREGRLRLALDRFPETITVRFVGYVPERIVIERDGIEDGIVTR